MKILVYTTDFYPLTGGVATYLDLLTKQLSIDNEVIVYTMTDNDFTCEFMHNKVKVKQFFKQNKLMGFYTNKKMIEEAGKDKPDVILANHYGYYPSIAASKASKKYNIPYIFIGYFHPPIYGMVKSILFWAFYYVYGRSVITKAHKVICCSKVEGDYMLSLGAKKIRIAPLIVDHDIYNNNLSYFKDSDVKTILYCGPLVWWKGFNAFATLADRIIPEGNVNIIIKTTTGVNSLAIKLQTKYGPEKVRIITENYSKQQLAELYRKVDLMVSPSYYESFGITMAECLACGTPVVSTTQGAIPEVVIDHSHGELVGYNDINSLYNTVKKLLNDYDLRAKYGLHGAMYSLERYNKNRIKKIMEAELNECINKKV